MNKYDCLQKAIEITKEYARGGGSRTPELVLRDVYNELVRLAQEAKGL